MGMGDVASFDVLTVALGTCSYGLVLAEAESLWVRTQLVALVFHWLTFLMKVVAAGCRFRLDDVIVLPMGPQGPQ